MTALTTTQKIAIMGEAVKDFIEATHHDNEGNWMTVKVKEFQAFLDNLNA
jgi:hypothetical protein